MKSNLILYFENIKLRKSENVDSFLSKEDKSNILKWYNDNVNELGNAHHALKFMYELYVRENIDEYEVSEFQRVAKSLSDEYDFDVKSFLSILEKFRTFIYD